MEKNIFYDKGFRNKVRQLDEETLIQLVSDYTSGVRVKMLVNTKETLYCVIPAQTDDLSLQLGSLQAGAAISILTLSTAGSLGSASSTISTAGSGTAFSIGPGDSGLEIK